MKAFHAGVFTLASLALSFAFSAISRADVRTLEPVQTLSRPSGTTFTGWGRDVAIDGGHIIVLAIHDGGQQALLYRRNTNGQWVYRRALETWTGAFVRANVAMKNGIAAVQFGDQISIFEVSGGDYVRAPSDAPIRHHGGLAISGNSVLVGGNNCDYDAVIYQKNTAGSWTITGRLDDNQGQCLSEFESYSPELNYNYAILRAPFAREAQAWRRNGSALDWIPAGVLALLPDEGVSDDAYALQGATAVAPNGVAWRRSGTSTWTRLDKVRSVDRDHGNGVMFDAVYRDGLLLVREFGPYAFPRIYVEASPGGFEHVASLITYENVPNYDVSGRTIVATRGSFTPEGVLVQVFTLPAPLRAPTPVVNDFEDRNVSDFTFSGGQFVLAARGSDDVLVQNASNGMAIGILNDTDWADHQRVEAEITPTYSGSGSWVGLVARYVDSDNFYYAVVRDNRSYGIYKRVNGVNTLLYEDDFYNEQSATFRATLRVVGSQIDVSFSFQQGNTITDTSLPRGRGGIATWMARAEFDDVHVAGTDDYLLFEREYRYPGESYLSGLTQISGDWQVIYGGDDEQPYLDGLAQRDISGSAVAVIGTPVPNQELIASMRLDAYGTSQQGAWFGLLARYVDANNHYYVTARSTGQIQIRKIVNGVITVLSSANFTAVPGQYYDVRFLVINDQLQLYVNRTLIATAHDHDIASGQYGLATYRATANWAGFAVLQP